MTDEMNLPPGVELPAPTVRLNDVGACPPCSGNKHWFPTDDPSGLCRCGARDFQSYDFVLGGQEGCRCAGCGGRYRVDVLVPDALWRRVARRPEELLCGSCIMTRIEEMGDFGAFRLEEQP